MLQQKYRFHSPFHPFSRYSASSEKPFPVQEYRYSPQPFISNFWVRLPVGSQGRLEYILKEVKTNIFLTKMKFQLKFFLAHSTLPDVLLTHPNKTVPFTRKDLDRALPLVQPLTVWRSACMPIRRRMM